MAFVNPTARRRKLSRFSLGSATVVLPRYLALALAVFRAQDLQAQARVSLPSLDSGATVRLQLRSGTRVTGTLLTPFGPDSSSFRYCLYPAPPCVTSGHRYAEQPAANVVGVQVRRGTHAIPGVAIGSVVGVGLGFALIDLGESLGESTYSSSKKTGVLTLSTLLWAGLGLMVGAGLDKWVSLDGGLP
jgi:hypothetical protein